MDESPRKPRLPIISQESQEIILGQAGCQAERLWRVISNYRVLDSACFAGRGGRDLLLCTSPRVRQKSVLVRNCLSNPCLQWKPIPTSLGKRWIVVAHMTLDRIERCLERHSTLHVDCVLFRTCDRHDTTQPPYCRCHRFCLFSSYLDTNALIGWICNRDSFIRRIPVLSLLREKTC